MMSFDPYTPSGPEEFQALVKFMLDQCREAYPAEVDFILQAHREGKIPEEYMFFIFKMVSFMGFVKFHTLTGKPCSKEEWMSMLPCLAETILRTLPKSELTSKDQTTLTE